MEILLGVSLKLRMIKSPPDTDPELLFLKGENHMWEQEIDNAFARYPAIPSPVVEAMKRYVFHGCDTGSFVQALLENNFARAVCRADENSQKCLRELAWILHNDFPGVCWGSPEKVKAWKDRGGLLGRKGL